MTLPAIELQPTVKRKRCSACGRLRLARYFYIHRVKGRKPGLQARCKDCNTTLGRVYNRPDPAKRSAQLRWGKILRLHGLTREQYEEMERAQGGVCAICRQPNDGKPLCVDHCHAIGKVRKLLCDLCNRGIGFLRDDPTIADAAAAYLREHGK